MRNNKKTLTGLIILILMLITGGCFGRDKKEVLTLDAPVLPVSRTFTTAPQDITLPVIAGTTVYYTTDGTTPTSTSTSVTTTKIVTITTTTTIKAFVKKAGSIDSAVSSATYTINLLTADAPALPLSTIFTTAPQDITLPVLEGTTLYYTVDGTIPTDESASIITNTSITISITTTIKAFVKKMGYIDSTVSSETYTISLVTNAAPELPVSRTFTTAPQDIMIPVIAGTTVYYTTDESTPTAASASITTNTAITITTTTSIKAFVKKAGCIDSSVSSSTYTISLVTNAAPELPVSRTFTTAPQDIMIPVIAGTTVHYTLDGTTPTAASTSITTNTVVTINTTTTIKAFVKKAGCIDSAVSSSTFTISLVTNAAPELPVSTTFTTAPQNIMIPVISGTTVHYTLDGTTPTAASTSITTNTSVTINTTTTIKAFVKKTGCIDSAVSSATYTISLLTADAPELPVSRTFTTTPQNIMIPVLEGTTVYYTIDGTIPTAISTSITTNTSVTINTTTTIKAFVKKASCIDSAVSSATYTISIVSTIGQSPIILGTSGNYAILAKTGISTTGTTSILGNIGLSPASQSYVTGFSEALDATNEFATAGIVTGKIYAADMAVPTPANLTTAVSDMETAFTDAAGRTLPDFTEIGAGDISGMTLVPGLYKWGTGVLITSDITLSGTSNDVWIFQIASDLTVANGVIITLSGGAQAKNIFWQVSGSTTLGTTSDFKGIILCQTNIVMETGSVMTGRALSQTAVTLDSVGFTQPAQ